MRTFYQARKLFLIGLLSIANMAVSQEKLAQTGLKFLNIGTDARCQALGGAVTALEGYSSSMFYNPSTMAWLKANFNASVGTTLWIADISYSFAAISINPGDGEWGVFGLSLQTVNYGDLYETIPATNTQGYIDVGKFSPTAYAIGLGYARALSERFSVGANIKYAAQNLGTAFYTAGTKKEFKVGVPAFDLGVFYRTGFKSLNFGMSVRNFAREIRYEDENFQLPLTFRIGISMDVMDLLPVDKEQQSFTLSVDAEHPRDFKEQIRLGGEYRLFNLFALRAGYLSGTDEEGVSLGVGGIKNFAPDSNLAIGFDYAYTPFGVFGNVHRFSFQFTY